MISAKNFAGQLQLDVGNETAFTHCNFSQRQPRWNGSNWVGWQIFSGNNVPMYFKNCNLRNVEVPAGSIVDGGPPMIIIQSNVQVSSETVTIKGAGEDVVIEVPIHGDIFEGKQTTPGNYEYNQVIVQYEKRRNE